MECQDVYKLMNRYIDQEITAEEEKVLEFHLGRCKDCQKEFSRLKEMNEILNTLEPSHDFTVNVMARIKKERVSLYRRWLPKSRTGRIAVAAAILFGVLLISPAFGPGPAQEMIISSGQVQTQVNDSGEKQMTVVDGEIRIKGLNGKVTAINSQIVFEGTTADLDISWWGQVKQKISALYQRVSRWFSRDEE